MTKSGSIAISARTQYLFRSQSGHDICLSQATLYSKDFSFVRFMSVLVPKPSQCVSDCINYMPMGLFPIHYVTPLPDLTSCQEGIKLLQFWNVWFQSRTQGRQSHQKKTPCHYQGISLKHSAVMRAMHPRVQRNYKPEEIF